VASGVQPTIGFTGHVNDVDTGLTYMQQRYYDPVAGRFLSIDPVVTDANTGYSFNRYAYANHNPYKFIDPDGRCPVEKDGVKCTAEIKPGIKISDSKLVDGLNKIAAEINKKIEVYSGDRDPAKNAMVGEAKNSAHTLGKGADVRVPGTTKRETAKMIFESPARVESGIRQIYHLPDNGKLPEHTHLDTLPGPDLQQNPGGKYAPLSVFDEN
jgi:RHS repeat-associated protein